MGGVKAPSGVRLVVEVVVESSLLPVERADGVDVIVQQEARSPRHGISEACLHAHGVARQMEVQVGLGELQPVDVYLPERTFFSGIVGDGVAQSNVEPSATDIGGIDADGIAHGVYGMALEMKPVETCADAEVADKIGGIGMQTAECQLV